MIIIIHLLIISVILYLFFSLYAIKYGLEKLNRYFVYITLGLLFWSLCNLFIIYSSNGYMCMFWYRISAFAQCFVAPYTAHFFIVFTGKSNYFRTYTAKFLFYLPAIILLIAFLTDHVIVNRFVVAEPKLIYMTVNYSFWLFYYIACQFSYVLIGWVVILRWKSNLRYSSELKQSFSILGPYTITMILTFSSALSILHDKIDFFMLVPCLAIFGTGSLWYAAYKYKWVTLTPALAVENILNTMADSVLLVDPEYKIQSVNNETLRMLHYESEELIGRKLDIILDMSSFSDKDYSSEFKSGSIKNYESSFITKYGAKVPVVLSASEYRDDSNTLVGIIIISRDITAQKEAEKNLAYLAYHDTLTGLPNRLLFYDRLEQAIARADRYGFIIAIMLLDIDGFKEINDFFGHNEGDYLLIKVSERLKKVIREIDTLARLGGDEFILIINDLKSESDIPEIAKKIHNVFDNAFTIRNHKLNITTSTGISVYPRDGNNINELIRNADIALYHAKGQGKNNYQLYKPMLSKKGTDKFIFQNRLRRAVEDNEFVVFYQPIVDVFTREIIGMEALVRWNDPEKGLIPPNEFIHIAEETGIIVQIGEFVMRTACLQNSKWIKSGLLSTPVSVNLSATQFKQPNLIDMIMEILNETGLEPRYLQLEITETTAMSNAAKTLSIMNELYEKGITFIIDDFGIGYSSLNYLKNFPVSTIKIDRSFIKNIVENKNDAAIATAILALAETMNIKVIAEGVEKPEQLEFLKKLNWKPAEAFTCHGAQGYYFSKPLPAELFEKNYILLHM